jgi:hypothetical protein
MTADEFCSMAAMLLTVQRCNGDASQRSSGMLFFRVLSAAVHSCPCSIQAG